MPDPTIRVAPIDEFRPQTNNANKHTVRGIHLLSTALAEDGFVAPMTSAQDGEILDGSARLEAVAEQFGEEVLVIEHDGTRPIIMKRTDIPDADNTLARRIALRANRIAQLDLDWDTELLGQLAENEPELLEGGWNEKEQRKILDLLEKQERQASEDEAAGDAGKPEIGRWDVPDAVWPTDNDLGIPVLEAELQATALELPVVIWGSIGRKTRMRGTWLFYTEDYRYTALWTDPSDVVNSRCVAVVEPNYSCYEHMPAVVGLWAIYRKRWLARYWQSYGIRVFVDLNVAPAFYRYNLLGVPEGWGAYATRGYAERLEYTEQEYAMAKERAAGSPVLFVVYGGGRAVELRCQERGWGYIPETMSSKHLFRKDVEEKAGDG